METSYTILLCVLGLAFVTTLTAVMVLTMFYLRKRRSRSTELEELLMEPFAKLEHKASFNSFNVHRQSNISIAETEAEVFNEKHDGTSRMTQITVSLFHIPNDERLVLDVWSVVDAPSDFSTGYVEAQLFPSDFEAGQFRTNVRESVDDVIIFNESFILPDVTSDVLTRVHLKLFLYACDGVAQPQCVGHVVFSLRDIQWNPLGKTQFQKELIKHKTQESLPTIKDEEPPTSSRDKGELYVSLRYQKRSGRINVVVLKAENIQKGKMLQHDPYVKIKFLYQGDVIEKRQTKARKRTSHPCWNQPFVFDVDDEKGLDNYELVFLIRRRDLISPRSSLGFIRIGAQVGGGGQSHWYAMMAKGNLMRQVARCHKIQ